MSHDPGKPKQTTYEDLATAKSVHGIRSTKPIRARAILDGKEFPSESSTSLARRIESLHLADFGEIWLEEEGEDRPRICALLSPSERGWLMYLRHAGDGGFTSRNPEYQDSDRMLRYTSANGQVDEYPATWSYPLATLKRALMEFLESPGPPRSIEWFDEDLGQQWKPRK